MGFKSRTLLAALIALQLQEFMQDELFKTALLIILETARTREVFTFMALRTKPSIVRSFKEVLVMPFI